MCLLITLEGKWPDSDTLIDAEKANPDGIGVAYIENSEVVYMKGITLAELEAMRDKFSVGLIHFRWATVGSKSKELCHPFPVDRYTGTPRLYGKSSAVLAHNGHLHDWQDMMMKSLTPTTQIPDGEFSDTRAMAWLTALYGVGFLRLIQNQKVAVLSKDGIQHFGRGWVDKDGYKLSNESFKPFVYTGRPNLYTTATGRRWDNDRQDFWGDEDDDAPEDLDANLGFFEVSSFTPARQAHKPAGRSFSRPGYI